MSVADDQPVIVRSSVAAVLIPLVIVTVLCFGLPLLVPTRDSLPSAIVAGTVMLAITCLATWFQSRRSVTFTSTEVTNATALSRWTVARADITSWRRVSSRSGVHIELSTGPGLTYDLPPSRQATHWLEGLPDADAPKRAELDRRIIADDRLGSTAAQRRSTARAVGYALAGLVILNTLLMVALVFGVGAPQIGMTAAAGPIVAFVAAAWLKHRPRARDPLSVDAPTVIDDLIPLPVVFTLADMVFIFVLFNLHIENWVRLLLLGLLAGTVLLGLVARLVGPPKFKGAEAASRVFANAVIVLFGIGVVAVADVGLDRSDYFPSDVPLRRHEQVGVDHRVCIERHRGLFGVGWHTARRCD